MDSLIHYLDGMGYFEPGHHHPVIGSPVVPCHNPHAWTRFQHLAFSSTSMVLAYILPIYLIVMGTSPYNLFPPPPMLVYNLEPYVQVGFLPYGRRHLRGCPNLGAKRSKFIFAGLVSTSFPYWLFSTFATIMRPIHIGPRCFPGQVWVDMRGNPIK